MSDSFCAGIMHCANPDPAGYRQTKDVSVTAKGGMECLAQTSDIDKAGSQSACREEQRGTVACMHACIHTRTRTHAFAYMDAFAKDGTHLIYAYASKVQGLTAQIDNWVSGQDTAEL